MKVCHGCDMDHYHRGIFEWWANSAPGSPFIEFLTSVQHVYCGVPTWSVSEVA